MLCMLSIAQLMQADPHVWLRVVGGHKHNTRGFEASEGYPANGTFHFDRIFEILIQPGPDVLLGCDLGFDKMFCSAVTRLRLFSDDDIAYQTQISLAGNDFPY